MYLIDISSSIMNTEKKAEEAASVASTDEISAVDERKLLRKIDSRVLPALTLLYLLSFLDRSNGSFTLYIVMVISS